MAFPLSGETNPVGRYGVLALREKSRGLNTLGPAGRIAAKALLSAPVIAAPRAAGGGPHRAAAGRLTRQ
jgi:hypothetical protein